MPAISERAGAMRHGVRRSPVARRQRAASTSAKRRMGVVFMAEKEKQKALSVSAQGFGKSDLFDSVYPVTRRRPDSGRIIMAAIIVTTRRCMRAAGSKTGDPRLSRQDF